MPVDVLVSAVITNVTTPVNRQIRRRICAIGRVSIGDENLDLLGVTMTTPSLPGNTAIVTGASRGFGRAIATALTKAGAAVIGVARDAAALADLERQLGPSFMPVVADVADDKLAHRLIAQYQPTLLVLNAGANPHPGTLRDQTWHTFSQNWEIDVRHVFSFVQAALGSPLAPGSTVISMSSGAARMGSPMSGGYAGAKATIKFISAYAGVESDRTELGIRFVALLPKLTPATTMGSTFVDAYAVYSNVDRGTFLEQFGGTLTVDAVGAAVTEIATSASPAVAYSLTTDGLAELA
jgi:NADP-dependent 3-hydroxy acid dehydrogenase YdfG